MSFPSSSWRVRLVSTLFVAILLAGHGGAEIYYVNGSISTSGDGGWNSPFKTIMEAVNECSVNGPNTILVNAAVSYHEHVIINGKHNLTLKPWGSQKPVIDGEGSLPTSQFNNTTLALIEIIDSHDVTVDSFIVQNSDQCGITARNTDTGAQTDDIIVENCEIDVTQHYGIVAYGGDPKVYFQFNLRRQSNLCFTSRHW